MNDNSILLIGHGSRHPEGNPQIERFTAEWRDQHPDWHIELCFIEFANIEIERGLDNAAANGKRVIIIPLVLNAAGHVRAEIPHYIEHAKERHPDTIFAYTPPITADEPVFKILKRNLMTCTSSLDFPAPSNTGVIVLGRGSSDRKANGEISKIARWLFEEAENELVDIAFTGVTTPRLETVVQRQIKLGMKQVIILPLYLFNGTLIERIGKQIARLRQQYPRIAFSCSSYFGFEAEIKDVLNDRVAAVLDSGNNGEFKDIDLSAHHHHEHSE
jgi:sirohydrochlorin cobaltochelatase